MFARFVLAVGLLLAIAASFFSRTSADDAREPGAVLRHVVFFKFSDTIDAAKRDELVAAFRALPGKIQEIRALEWGTDVGVENLSKGFTHCFFLTFADEQARDAYLPHPAHQEFVAKVKPHLDDVCVIDYWTRR